MNMNDLDLIVSDAVIQSDMPLLTQSASLQLFISLKQEDDLETDGMIRARHQSRNPGTLKSCVRRGTRGQCLATDQFLHGILSML